MKDNTQQPLIDGRYVGNKIIQHLTDGNPNIYQTMHSIDGITIEEIRQFYQLLGYSKAGMEELEIFN